MSDYNLIYRPHLLGYSIPWLMTVLSVTRELPPELIELALIYAWLEPSTWPQRVLDYAAFTTVCKMWMRMMQRISLRFVHTDLIYAHRLEDLFRRRVNIQNSTPGLDGLAYFAAPCRAVPRKCCTVPRSRINCEPELF